MADFSFAVGMVLFWFGILLVVMILGERALDWIERQLRSGRHG